MESQVAIPLGNALLNGSLTVPEDAGGIVLFVHGSGSSRLSPRNRMVADVLQQDGFATLLFDLLTDVEEQEDSATGIHRFNISLLTTRLSGASDWIARNKQTSALPMGYFGASTGAGAALAGRCAPLVDYLVVVKGSIYSSWAVRPDGHILPGYNLDLTQMVRAAVGRSATRTTPGWRWRRRRTPPRQTPGGLGRRR